MAILKKESGTAVCVNVTTKRDDSETTVVLTAADHRFIKHESVVRFSDAREMKIELVEKLLSSRPGQFVGVLHDPCSEKLLARIRQGLLDSPMTPKEIKRKCKEIWGR